MSEAVEPLPGARYTDLAWRGHADPFRAGFGILLGLMGYLLVLSGLLTALLRLAFAVHPRGMEWPRYVVAAAHFEFWEGFAATNVALACLIPISLLAARYGVGMPARYLVSVTGRVRWGYALAVFGAALVVFNAAVWTLQRADMQHYAPQAGAASFLVAMLLTSPLQAAGEEFFFRGLLQGAVGAATKNPALGIGISALIFAGLHGSQSLPLFLDRLAFGVIAGILVRATGGLEAGIAAHVANNLCAFTYAALFSTIATARTQSTVTWVQALADVAVFAVIALVAWGLTRLFRPATAVAAQPPAAGVGGGLAQRRKMR